MTDLVRLGDQETCDIQNHNERETRMPDDSIGGDQSKTLSKSTVPFRIKDEPLITKSDTLPLSARKVRLADVGPLFGYDVPIDVELVDWGVPREWQPLALRVSLHPNGALIEQYLYERHTGVYYDKQRQIWRANWRESATCERKTRNFSATPSMCSARMEAIIFKEKQHAQYRVHNLSVRMTDATRRLYDCELVRYDLLHTGTRGRSGVKHSARVPRPVSFWNPPAAINIGYEPSSLPSLMDQSYHTPGMNTDNSTPLGYGSVSPQVQSTACSYSVPPTSAECPTTQVSPCSGFLIDPTTSFGFSMVNSDAYNPFICADEYPPLRELQLPPLDYSDHFSSMGNMCVGTDPCRMRFSDQMDVKGQKKKKNDVDPVDPTNMFHTMFSVVTRSRDPVTQCLAAPRKYQMKVSLQEAEKEAEWRGGSSPQAFEAFIHSLMTVNEVKQECST
eukprot:GHVN01004018.1.p1 GENE.GHVN01004018.1~~GHVN01004018.1.p1  ORF type:complete len:447 (-),score=47.34 GHVN01004018.1:87-1427(-)